MDARVRVGERAPRPRRRPRRARPRGAASSASIHGVGCERLEDDQRAGGAPAVPRLGLRLEGAAQRAHHDRVLLAHAQQHQVQRELEAEVLQEQREVEALVELDRDEDGLQRERVPPSALLRRTLDPAGRARRLAVSRNARQAWPAATAARDQVSKKDSPSTSWPRGRTAARPAPTTSTRRPGRPSARSSPRRSAAAAGRAGVRERRCRGRMARWSGAGSSVQGVVTLPPVSAAGANFQQDGGRPGVERARTPRAQGQRVVKRSS